MPRSLEDMTVDELRAHAATLEGNSNLLRTLAANPETREVLQRAIKKVAPNTPIPEIDAADRVMAAVATEREERLKLERTIMERDARDNVRDRRAKIKADYKLTDEDVTAIEKMMVDDKEVNWTHDAAARVYLAERRSSVPTPASYQPPVYTMPEKDVWGPGIGNKAKLDKIGMEQAYAALGEIMGGKAAGAGPLH
jgi:hypothetical protein